MQNQKEIEGTTPLVLAFTADRISASIHQHSAFQLILTNDAPFHCSIGGQLYENIYGFFVKPNVPHTCENKNSLVTVINVEPYSPPGFYLNTLFAQNESMMIFSDLEEAAKTFFISSSINVCKSIIKQIINVDSPQRMDERVMKVIRFIESNYHQKLNPELLGNHVFLSQSRLSSVFKGQTGSSLSKYILWVRIKQVIIRCLSKNELSLTEIAYKCGFYDLPQMNKYMYELLGITPTIFRKNSDMIQVNNNQLL